MNRIEIAGGGYTARIDPAHGANCISLRHSGYGVVLLREPTCGDGEPDNPYLYGMPLLFPVNRISGGCFTLDGRDYRFPINEPSTGCHLHGTLHRAPFAVEVLEADRVVLARRETAYHGFPHAFELRIGYALSEGGLLHETEVINLSDTPMPCMLGYHTTFNAAFAGGREVRAQVGIAAEYERNMKNYLPTGRMPAPDAVSRALQSGDFSPFSEPISRHYRASADGRMTIYDRAHGLRLVYENDTEYAYRLIYNGAADEYICMEPQTCAINAPNTPYTDGSERLPLIAPHESKKYTSKIYLEDIET